MKAGIFVLLAFLAVVHCASVLNADCEYGPFDVAEAEQHLNCTVVISADFAIGSVFGYAYIPLNEASNANPNYVPPVKECSQTFETGSSVSSLILDCEVELPRFSADGVYTFSVYVFSEDSESYLFNTSFFEVEQERNDRTPPTLVALTAPASYNAFFPTSNWVVLDLADDASGITEIYYSVHSTIDGGNELYFGHWAFEAEHDHEHEHEHEEEEHEHEEEEHEHEEDEHEHEHEEEGESAPTELQITLPLSLRDHADEFTPGVYYLTVHVWDAFWDARYNTYELRSNGFKWNVTLVSPSNCPAGKYGPKLDKPNQCQNCPIGTYSGAGATKCAPCPTGSIPNAAKDACVQCPLGTYEFTGLICVPCPSGYSAPLGAYTVRQCEKI